jgi:hypothetical protein
LTGLSSHSSTAHRLVSAAGAPPLLQPIVGRAFRDECHLSALSSRSNAKLSLEHNQRVNFVTRSSASTPTRRRASSARSMGCSTSSLALRGLREVRVADQVDLIRKRPNLGRRPPAHRSPWRDLLQCSFSFQIWQARPSAMYSSKMSKPLWQQFLRRIARSC